MDREIAALFALSTIRDGNRTSPGYSGVHVPIHLGVEPDSRRSELDLHLNFPKVQGFEFTLERWVRTLNTTFGAELPQSFGSLTIQPRPVSASN